MIKELEIRKIKINKNLKEHQSLKQYKKRQEYKMTNYKI